MCATQSDHFTPAWPHGKIREVFKDVFFVTGTNKTIHDGIHIQTSRNMVIIRHGSELTLINTVRLDTEGLKELDLLGNVSHIIRIGAFHGRDDAFYRNQYPSSLLWTLKGMTYENGLTCDRELMAGGHMPFPGCAVFVFKTSIFPEGVLSIERDSGILISCDSIQNITCTDYFYSAETAHTFETQGLVKPANISPIWLWATQTKGADFYRLLETVTFRHLITAHGEPMKDVAFEKVTETISSVFGI